MTKTLNNAFNAAKKDRQLLSKIVIYESGVSKSQFYRIINGDEAPSPETKSKIAKSLNISLEEFDTLHSQSKSDQETDNLSSKKKPYLPLLYLGLSVISMGLIIFFVSRLKTPGDKTTETLSSTLQSIATPEDRTLFISDVTIPDGTQIPINTKFVKTWRVKNIGTVVWKDRFLKRTTLTSDFICTSPAMVPIPETQPGETIDISVTFVTPHLPGSCRTDWKAADKNGNLYYPDMHGLFSIVTVVKE